MGELINWPHGIHYGREEGTRGTNASMGFHKAIPHTPVDGDADLDALVMVALLRMAP